MLPEACIVQQAFCTDCLSRIVFATALTYSLTYHTVCGAASTEEQTSLQFPAVSFIQAPETVGVEQALLPRLKLQTHGD